MTISERYIYDLLIDLIDLSRSLTNSQTLEPQGLQHFKV